MFILIFITGLLFTLALSKEFKLLERLSLSFPLGLGLSSFLLFLTDQFLHSVNLSVLGIGLLLLSLLFLGKRLYFDWKAGQLFKFEKPSFDFSGVNLVWLIFAGMTAYLVYGITIKCLYWPPAEFDTVVGYDLLAKAIAHEGTIKNTMLTNAEVVNDCGPRLLYPPLLALCNSICYMSGMETPKLINSLFFVSWVVLFYSLLRRFATSTSSIFFTLFAVITPEMFAHASFSLTNLPCAIYTCTAVIAITIWYEKKIEGFFYLSLFMMAFAVWTRSDVVVFIAAIMALLLIYSWKTKTFKHLLLYSLSAIPFVIWTFYLKANVPKGQGVFFVKKLFFDTGKLGDVLSTAWGLMTNENTYGLTFYIFFLALLINAYALYKTKDKWNFLLVFFIALTGYTLLYYQMDNTDGTLFTPGGWMQSGYKRGLFCYAPLGLFYAASSKYVSLAFNKAEEYLTLFKAKTV